MNMSKEEKKLTKEALESMTPDELEGLTEDQLNSLGIDTEEFEKIFEESVKRWEKVNQEGTMLTAGGYQAADAKVNQEESYKGEPREIMSESPAPQVNMGAIVISAIKFLAAKMNPAEYADFQQSFPELFQ
jgi:hypothetical protein